MNLLELLGVAILSGAIGAMALAFLCVHFDGSGKPLGEDVSTLDELDGRRHNGRSGL